MTKLQHTHDSGRECLACDIACVSRYCAKTTTRDDVLDALDRIEAALAEREHLEEAARQNFVTLDSVSRAKEWLSPEELCWLEAERARKGEKG